MFELFSMKMLIIVANFSPYNAKKSKNYSLTTEYLDLCID